MEEVYAADKDFDNEDFSKNLLLKGDYESCNFVNCNFSNSDLSSINFSECTFDSCDFSNAKITKTAFRNVQFNTCKLLGLHFENCNEFLFSANYDSCQIDFSSFYTRSLKDTLFKDCSLQEVDFAESDLTSAIFENCDLKGAKFENSILEKTDFRTAINYTFDPDINRISKAKFSIPGVVGLLDKYDIKIG